jgi:acyl-CoA hydrolase
MARQVQDPGQRITADQAAGLVRSGMWLDYGAGLCQPDAFDRALAARRDALHAVKVRACLTTRPRAILLADPEGAHFFWFNSHFGGFDRKMHDAGIANYLPVNLGEVPDYYRRFIDPVDIVILRCAPMDDAGFFNFGPTNLWHNAVIERARMVVIEECAAMPRVTGPGSMSPGNMSPCNGVHVSEVDFVIRGDDTPLPELPKAPATEVDRAVARHIAAELEDGDCLQIGIGGMPNAVCSLLKESTISDLGIHTEMLTDGIIDLYRAGKITGARKQLDPGRIVCTFGLGSQYLYDAAHQNPDIEFHPVDYTNLPHIIMRNDRVKAINNTTQMDLQGQAASESDGHRHISGTGGQLQFMRGAYASRGGKSFMCLASTYDKRGERRSRIVTALTRGNIVTTPRTDIMYVVTEYGIANLKGRSVAERAHLLIGLAHPDFREGLERDAYEHRLIPRGFF